MFFDNDRELVRRTVDFLSHRPCSMAYVVCFDLGWHAPLHKFPKCETDARFILHSFVQKKVVFDVGGLGGAKTAGFFGF